MVTWKATIWRRVHSHCARYASFTPNKLERNGIEAKWENLGFKCCLGVHMSRDRIIMCFTQALYRGGTLGMYNLSWEGSQVGAESSLGLKSKIILLLHFSLSTGKKKGEACYPIIPYRNVGPQIKGGVEGTRLIHKKLLARLIFSKGTVNRVAILYMG